MPVPPLPIELVRLILSFAAASLPEVERRGECVKCALVCRAWKDIAIRLAWEEISLWKAGDQYVALMDHLTQSPQLSGLIKTLDLRTPRKMSPYLAATPPEPEDDASSPTPRPHELLPPDDLPRLHDLLPLCSAVQHVTAPCYAQNDDFLHSLVDAPFAPQLRSLEYRYVMLVPKNLDVVTLALCKFRNLTRLDIGGGFVWTGTNTLSPINLAQTERIPVSDLQLDVMSMDDADLLVFPRLFVQAVLAAVRIETLRKCKVQTWNGDLTLLDYLRPFQNLSLLAIFCAESKVLADCASSIWTALKTLPRVKFFSMISMSSVRHTDTGTLITSGVSPVPLVDVLRAVPSTLSTVMICGLLFQDLEGIPTSTAADKAALVHSCEFSAMPSYTYADGAGQDARRNAFKAVVCRRYEVDGAVEWTRIVPKTGAATPAT